ncbi:hypothetical protein KCU88_g296, partial [Aureobasidium melanogenum]
MPQYLGPRKYPDPVLMLLPWIFCQAGPESRLALGDELTDAMPELFKLLFGPYGGLSMFRRRPPGLFRRSGTKFDRELPVTALEHSDVSGNKCWPKILRERNPGRDLL